MMWHWFHWGFGGWWLMFVVMIAFWGLIIWGIIALVRTTTHRNNADSDTRHPDAMEILKTRYARGEITREEFEERKKVINSRD
jgi:putative membrane protein